ncbi:hypothetical protein EAI28_23850 [Faecalicatena contorta]|uniref:acyltransferase family protein n=1 Tax=Faecalicatena contorta TaxID=39482 RepID=UPI00129D38BE|nr:acyltransferase family protein [Faecalicatena contorta]MRM91348.1 hypothetical protein [Faecalicatena contorta]
MFKRIDTLKVKGIAISLLLFHHLFYSTARIEANGVVFHIFSQDTVEGLATASQICVWIFAFLSAYGLTCKYIKEDIKRPTIFIAKSWISLMKSYWFIYIIVFILSFIFFNNPLEIYQHKASYLVLDALGLADFFGSPMLSNVWWYMCFAQILLIILPLIIAVCSKFGWASYLLMIIIIQYLGSGISSNFGGEYINYLLVIVLGVLCAQNIFFDKVKSKPKHLIGKIIEICILVGVIFICLILRLKLEEVDVWKVRSILSSLAVLCICWMSYKYLTNKIVEKVLSFLGKHSGNIFMTHALIYTFYPNVVYYTKNVILSWLTLLSISLCLSIVLEKLKELTKYNCLIKNIENMIFPE